MGVMGKAKPTMLVSFPMICYPLRMCMLMGNLARDPQLKQPLLSFMEPSTKLSLIRGKSYAGFLQRLTVTSA